MMDLEEICKEIVNAAREAGDFISKESVGFNSDSTENKGLNDFVSYVDKGSEKMLVDRLSLLLPMAGFIAEEGTSEKKGERYNWIIDPLDGTTNFLHGIHPHAISIALMEDEEIIAGVVYEVGGKETFKAWKDGGAWLNDRQIRVSRATKLSDSLIATGFPYTDFKRLHEYMNCLTHFCKNSRGIRRLGSAAIDLAYVACGKFDAFYEYGLHTWDVAAGILLVREAGGRVSDFSGNENNLSGNEIVAAADGVFSEVLENVSIFMTE
jgi:myo-inositol-1(or 4)-monophosphatase